MHISGFLKSSKRGKLTAALLVVFAASLHAQTAHSAGVQPASWFNPQTGEMGLVGFDAASRITPDGDLQNAFGELMFFSGGDLQPRTNPVDIHQQGDLPIAQYEFVRDGIAYRFTIFAGKIDKSAIILARQHAKFPFPPGFDIQSNIVEPEVNFIRIEMTNSTPQTNRAVLASGVRYQDPISAGNSDIGQKQTRQPFDPNWMNYFDDANFYRYNRDLYSFPAGYADRSFTLRKNWSEPNPQDVLGETRINPAPTTPIGIVTYARELKPGETWTLDFKMPMIPTADPFVIAAIDDSSLEAIEAQAHPEPAKKR